MLQFLYLSEMFNFMISLLISTKINKRSRAHVVRGLPVGQVGGVDRVGQVGQVGRVKLARLAR